MEKMLEYLAIAERFLSFINEIQIDDIEFFDATDKKIKVNNVNEIAEQLALHEECNIHVYSNNFCFLFSKDGNSCEYTHAKYDAKGNEKIILKQTC